MYLLDTNACIRILNASSAPLVARLSRSSPAEIKMCSVVKAELLFGARKSRRIEHNLQAVERLSAPFESLPFDDRSAQEYGLIRADLAREGRVIGPNDMLIAAIARAHDAVLVTHNVDELSRVVGLRIEDWEAPT